MATIQDLANAIGKMEGANIAGSVASRNNNPGNLRYVGQTGAIGQDSGGFAIFPDLSTGQAALNAQINLDANRGLTLSQFIAKYAPPNENNTSNYLNFVSSQTGVDPSTTLDAGFRKG